MENGRCRMHGGKSLGGIASPRFVHGWYSSDPVFQYMRLVVETRERQVQRLRIRLAEIGLDPDLADSVS